MNIDIEHLASLARIKIEKSEISKFQNDLSKIFDHFKELEKLDTSGVIPMTGGTNLKNIFREDFAKWQNDSTRVVSAFPETKDGMLRVPEIFE